MNKFQTIHTFGLVLQVLGLSHKQPLVKATWEVSNFNDQKNPSTYHVVFLYLSVTTTTRASSDLFHHIIKRLH